jgi:NAD(P)-dependent dehydrogenase (short-subunit alcohol dehydrogenase family)
MNFSRKTALVTEGSSGIGAALPPLLERGREPAVLNVSSGLAIAPKKSAPVYCATKAALSNFSRGLRFQLAPRGIRVVGVVTPLVKTPMNEGRQRGAMEADTFVQKTLRALAAGRDEICVGRSRLPPRCSAWRRTAPGTCSATARPDSAASTSTVETSCSAVCGGSKPTGGMARARSSSGVTMPGVSLKHADLRNGRSHSIPNRFVLL